MFRKSQDMTAKFSSGTLNKIITSVVTFPTTLQFSTLYSYSRWRNDRPNGRGTTYLLKKKKNRVTQSKKTNR